MVNVKKIWLVLLLMGSVIMSSVKVSEAGFKLEGDKVEHIVVSAIIYDGTYLYCESRDLDRLHCFCYATLATVSAGIFKEEIDDVFDYDDLRADGIGLAIGITIMELQF